jgi:DNA-directed RNA polymerase specialized sigma24 family protein
MTGEAPTDEPDLDALCQGDKPAWDSFVRRFAGLVHSAARQMAPAGADLDDLAHRVFLRLREDNFQLLRTYDPARATLPIWLVINTRCAVREICDSRAPRAEPKHPPPAAPGARDLLSARQKLVLLLHHDLGMEISEIADLLRADKRTVEGLREEAARRLRDYLAR